MENEQTTGTERQQADKTPAEIAAEDAATFADLREGRIAGANWIKRAMLELGTKPSFDESEAAAIRLINALTLSVGRIVDMEDRFDRKPDAASADSDAARKEIQRLFSLDEHLFRAALDAAAAARKSAGDSESVSVVRPGNMGGSQS